jgi:glutamine synthetase
MVGGPSEDDPSLPKLPLNLEATLAGLEADAALRSLLGEPFVQLFTVQLFTTVKRFELERFHSHVTDWERQEYLEIC